MGLLVTLDPDTGPSATAYNCTVCWGGSVAGTVANLSDDSDATHAECDWVSNFVDTEDDGDFYEEYSLDDITVPAGQVLDKIIVRIRARHVAKSHGGDTLTIQPHINGTPRGTPIALTGSATWHEFEFTTDPADSNPWTEAKIDAQTFGFFVNYDTGSVEGTSDTWIEELEVEVYGHDEVMPTTVDSTAAVIAPNLEASATPDTVGATAAVVGPDLVGGIFYHNPSNISAAPGHGTDDIRNQAFPEDALGSVTGRASQGNPYFAVMTPIDTNNLHFPAGERRLEVWMSVLALPTKITNNDELHYFASIHETGSNGRERWSLGITPDGKLGSSKAGAPHLLSPPGVVFADGVMRKYELFSDSSTDRNMKINGVAVGADDANYDPYIAPSEPIRYMLFNGLAGVSRLKVFIRDVRYDDEGLNALRWPMVEADGLTVADYELTSTLPNVWTARAPWYNGPPQLVSVSQGDYTKLVSGNPFSATDPAYYLAFDLHMDVVIYTAPPGVYQVP